MTEGPLPPIERPRLALVLAALATVGLAVAGNLAVQKLGGQTGVCVVSRDTELSGLRDIQIPALDRCAAG